MEDFVYLTLVHEASEIHQRKKAETLIPAVKAEVRAEIEEAKAYFALSPERKRTQQHLYKMLDETNHRRKKIFSREVELFDSIGESKLGTIEGLLTFIDFVLEMPDYTRELLYYPDHRTRFQLAKSLFIDVLHDFASSNSAGKWVRAVENAAAFASKPVTYKITDNTKALSVQAEEILNGAARILETLHEGNAGATYLPSKSQKKRIIDSFNEQIAKLDPLKAKLQFDEVLAIPPKLRITLADNSLNRSFFVHG